MKILVLFVIVNIQLFKCDYVDSNGGASNKYGKSASIPLPSSSIISFYSSSLASDYAYNNKYMTTNVPSNLIDNDYSRPLNYCSFFNNRAPSPQINLKNCTWYKENSCCLQREIESTFSKVKPLIGSSEVCQQYINYLMCYICAPNQFKFYGKERLTVCVQYCDKMYEACADAILKGSKINEIYLNGEEFCKSRRYNIGDMKNDKCFYYSIQPVISLCTHVINNSLFNLIISLYFVYFYFN